MVIVSGFAVSRIDCWVRSVRRRGRFTSGNLSLRPEFVRQDPGPGRRPFAGLNGFVFSFSMPWVVSFGKGSAATFFCSLSYSWAPFATIPAQVTATRVALVGFVLLFSTPR